MDGHTLPCIGLYAVLGATGENYVTGAAHLLGLLALEETTSNADIVTTLNT